LLGIAGTYRYELGEERAALPHLRAYVELRPDDATAQFRLGATLLAIAAVPQGLKPRSLQVAQRDAEAAARAFTACAQLAPGDEDAALAIVSAQMRAAELAAEFGDLAARDANRQAANERLLAIVERFPANAEARFRLGALAEVRADPSAAKAAYLQALDLDAGHVASLLNLAALVATEGDRATASELLRRAVAADATKPQFTDDERKRVNAWLRRG
jgi:Flp pilus assembly protein TadD